MLEKLPLNWVGVPMPIRAEAAAVAQQQEEEAAAVVAAAVVAAMGVPTRCRLSRDFHSTFVRGDLGL